MSNRHCPTCTCGGLPVDAYRYGPTGETVEVLWIANLGQERPGDPGRGMRLYAVRFPDGKLGQASASELREKRAGVWHPFTVTDELRREADRLTRRLTSVGSDG